MSEQRPIEITPWWLRAIGKPPFRQRKIGEAYNWWTYLSLADAIAAAQEPTGET